VRARAALWIVAACALAYANAPAGSFHFDDAHAVQENPSIRSLRFVPRYFTDASLFSVLPQNQGYRPLLLVTYALTARFFGVNPHAFIAVNLLVHVLCALLLFAVLARTLRLLDPTRDRDPAALVGALVFAVHPLFSECVNYVSARSESLSALFTLAALYGYLRARESPRWLGVALMALAAALLTKPVATIFPLYLVAFEAAAAERHSLRRIAPRFFAMTAVVLVLGLVGAHLTPAFAIHSASSFTRAEYFRGELPAVWHYLRLFVWPTGQNADADYPMAPSFRAPEVVLAGCAWAALIAFAAWGLARRRHTGFALAVAWFILCIFPSSSIFPLAELVNEHRPYLAAASLCALSGVALVEGVPALLRLHGGDAREAVFTACIGVLVPLTALTLLRNRVWHDEESLWADVVAKSPQSTRAQMNLGLAIMGAGRFGEAEPHLREAVRLAPTYAYAHINLGNLFLAQGKRDEARAELDRALALDPSLFWAPYFRGLLAERTDEPAPIRLEQFTRTTRLSPTYADGWYHRSLAEDALGDTAGALASIRHAVYLRGGYDDRFMLAFLLLKRNDAAAARPILVELQRERPADSRIAHDLALAAQMLEKK
jgi:tetratricopeptide (TPR) repeat protein